MLSLKFNMNDDDVLVFLMLGTGLIIGFIWRDIQI